LNEYKVDLVVLAGFLVVIPPEMIAQYHNRIINIHPSLIPSSVSIRPKKITPTNGLPSAAMASTVA
jgi:folate-dependent phosphoribosylglycinamide formyltransferase PurN